MHFQGRMWLCHVISYIVEHRGLEEGKKVCHSCDTPRCVRPDHLTAKTDSENMLEMVARNRHKPRFGLANNLGKLSDDQVIEIRNHLQGKTRTIKSLADEHHVTFQSIWRIGRGLARQSFGEPVIHERPVHKLSVEEVIDIRTRAKAGETQTSIAESYGIWPATVSNIVRGVKRKDVPLALDCPTV